MIFLILKKSNIINKNKNFKLIQIKQFFKKKRLTNRFFFKKLFYFKRSWFFQLLSFLSIKFIFFNSIYSYFLFRNLTKNKNIYFFNDNQKYFLFIYKYIFFIKYYLKPITYKFSRYRLSNILFNAYFIRSKNSSKITKRFSGNSSYKPYKRYIGPKHKHSKIFKSSNYN